MDPTRAEANTHDESHPVHAMLDAYPIALYSLTLTGFVGYALLGGPFWWRVGLWSNFGGVIMTLVAAVPELIVRTAEGVHPAFAGTDPRDARKRAMWPLALCAFACFATNLFVQRDAWGAAAEGHVGIGIALAVAGLAFTALAAYRGMRALRTEELASARAASVEATSAVASATVPAAERARLQVAADAPRTQRPSSSAQLAVDALTSAAQVYVHHRRTTTQRNAVPTHV